MTNAHDLERMAAYHAGDEYPPLKRDNRTPEGYYYEPDEVTPARVGTIEFNAAALLARVSTLEAANAALTARLARLEAIVDAIREYGEL